MMVGRLAKLNYPGLKVVNLRFDPYIWEELKTYLFKKYAH